MSRNSATGIGRVAASAAARRAVRLEADQGAVCTLGRHTLAAPRPGSTPAQPLEWLSIVGAALCEIADLRKELESIDPAGAAPLARALDVLHRDALRLLNSLAREVRGH